MASFSSSHQLLLVFRIYLFMLWSEAVGSRYLCPAGQVFDQTNEGQADCRRCPPGTFTPPPSHSYTECFKCTKVVDPEIEIFVSPCNPQQDTHIRCIDGYFRNVPFPPAGGQCQKCTQCHCYEELCTERMDSVCCSRKTLSIFNSKARDEEPDCVSPCGRGQYLDLTTVRCLDCPAGTHMPKERHTNNHCWKCNVPKSHHEIVIQPCNSTHPGVIGCVDGYYRPSLSASTSKHCAKCQVCSDKSFGLVFEGRPCDPFHNTVCCGHPDMIVVDTPEGPQCEQPAGLEKEFVRRCGKGEHFTIGPDGRSVICLPCPMGTCMTETDHFQTSCHPCDILEDPINSGQMGTSGLIQALVFLTAFCVLALR